MDIFEKYSKEDLQKVRELFEDYFIQERGIIDTLNYLSIAKNNIDFWTDYKKDREEENNPKQVKESSNESFQPKLGSKEFVKMFIQEKEKDRDKTEKMSEEKESEFEINVKEFQTNWDIVGSDKFIQQQIAGAIKDIQYDENDSISRAKVLQCILLGLDILNLDENKDDGAQKGEYIRWNDMYKAIIEKIEDLSYSDFIVMCQNTYNLYDLFENKQCANLIIKRIKELPLIKFSYFYLTTNQLTFYLNEELIQVYLKKLKEDNNLFLHEVYQEIYNNDTMENVVDRDFYLSEIEELYKYRFGGILNKIKYTHMNFEERKKYDKKLPLENSFKEYLKKLSQLSPKELVSFFIVNSYNFISMKNYKNNTVSILPEEQEVISKKLTELSNEDIILLYEKYKPKFGNETQWDKNIKTMQEANIPEVVEDLESKYSMYAYLILKEAIRRNLISSEFEEKYSKEDKNIATNREQLYFNIYTTDHFCSDIIEFEYMYDEALDEEEDNERLEELAKYIEMDEEIIENELKMCEGLNQAYNMSDIQLCQLANHYNNKINRFNLLKASKQRVNSMQDIYLNYIKKRILRLPTKYANFFELNENGCLNDVMEEKAEELPILEIEDEREI
ncbi:MAG: hypothetical protein IKF38_03755 [Clostridia bacterium]|nr:hypothetical protein [Clostridia bacterium]